MKNKLNQFIGLLVAVIILALTIICCLVFSSNKYEDDIASLEIENKQKDNQLETLMKHMKNNQDKECQYYIEEASGGYIIDGVLYLPSEEVVE